MIRLLKYFYSLLSRNHIMSVYLKQLKSFIYRFLGTNDVLEDELSILKRNNTKVIIDCGAFEGREATRYLKTTKAEVWLFEPQSTLIKKLSDRFQNNNRVFIRELALSDTSGRQEFFINQNQQTSSLLKSNDVAGFENDLKNESSAAVEVARLDEIPQLKEKKSIHLKIDVQGNEMRLLEGCAGILTNIDSLLIETHLLSAYSGQSKMTSVFDFLMANGFVCHGIYSQVKNTEGELLQIDSLWARH